jgi:predicted membrane-bound mannosyltransferase
MLCVDIINISGIAEALRPADSLPPNLPLNTLGAAGVLAATSGIGFFLGVPARDPRMRWFALYGLASFTAYSLIPYKTPWCSVNFLWPFCFVAGYALDQLCFVGSRWLVALVTVLLSAGSVQDAWRLNFVNPTNDALPPTRDNKPDADRYAYVQTTFDVNLLLKPTRALLRMNPRNREMKGLVLGEAFPLIWELNDFPNVSFEDPSIQLPAYDADFLIVPDPRRDEIEPQLAGIYFREPYLSRGSGEPSWLYLQAERFRPVLPAERTPELKPRVPMFR